MRVTAQDGWDYSYLSINLAYGRVDWVWQMWNDLYSKWAYVWNLP